ncbi:unnamed protein product [Linum tenue]|uniref:Uncharacterized protein n=1 Tax=Linum tenue TaxID=586396 RepID=A0AAV0PG84_9ROSI|nr:unnamed protein product [Linum tenue]
MQRMGLTMKKPVAAAGMVKEDSIGRRKERSGNDFAPGLCGVSKSYESFGRT